MKKILLISIILLILNQNCFLQTNNEIALKGGLQISLATIVGGGLSYGVGFQSNINEVFSAGLHLSSGNIIGTSTQIWTHSSKGGGLVEPFYEDYKNQDGWFPSYQFRSTSLELDFQIRPIEFIMYDDVTNKLNPYFKGSVGLIHKSTKLDLLGENGLPYSNLSKIASSYDSSTAQGRKDIFNSLLDVYDGNYETKLSSYDPSSIQFSYGGGLTYQLSQKVKIGLEYTITYFPDSKYMDGIVFRTAIDQVDGTDRLVNLTFLVGYKF